jgi:hypothetical protein
LSASIPSFFNKADFYGTLLPGYLLVLVYVFLYQPSILSAATSTSLDILWTVVFLVAGPVVGLTISEVSDIVEWYLWRYTRGRSVRVKVGRDKVAWTLKLNDFSYFWTRIHTQDNELNEIDLGEAHYNFGISAGSGLIGLGAYKLVYYQPVDWWAALSVITGAVLLIGAYYSYQAYVAVMSVVWEKHHLTFPEQLLSTKNQSSSRPPPPPPSPAIAEAPS